MDRAVRSWAPGEARRHPSLLRLGYFGSYATGRWGVGSDLDIVAIVRESGEPFDRRNLSWDLNALPVPAELLVYTIEEWEQLCRGGGRLARTLAAEAVWVFPGS